jgi:PilZ domain
MAGNEQRHINRDSLFMLACLRLNGQEPVRRVKIRNLSPGGLLAEGDMRVVTGTPLEIELRNLGWIAGSVAWVQENRFGIAFAEEIDPKSVRAAQAPSLGEPSFVPLRPLSTMNQVDPAQLRKV